MTDEYGVWEELAGPHEYQEAADDWADLQEKALREDWEAECRVCGCTENDCSQCIEKTGARCHWVPDPTMQGDLCSACVPEMARR